MSWIETDRGFRWGVLGQWPNRRPDLEIIGKGVRGKPRIVRPYNRMLNRYPVTLYGPFDTIEAAKITYLMVMGHYTITT